MLKLYRNIGMNCYIESQGEIKKNELRTSGKSLVFYNSQKCHLIASVIKNQAQILTVNPSNLNTGKLLTFHSATLFPKHNSHKFLIFVKPLKKGTFLL